MMEDATPGVRTTARLLLAAVVWMVRISIGGSQEGLGNILALPLDASLVVIHLWANRPLENSDPVRFGRNDSATKFLLAPVVIAALYLLRDGWMLLRLFV